MAYTRTSVTGLIVDESQTGIIAVVCVIASSSFSLREVTTVIVSLYCNNGELSLCLSSSFVPFVCAHTADDSRISFLTHITNTFSISFRTGQSLNNQSKVLRLEQFWFYPTLLSLLIFFICLKYAQFFYRKHMLE